MVGCICMMQDFRSGGSRVLIATDVSAYTTIIVYVYNMLIDSTQMYRCGAAVLMCSRCHWSSTMTSPPTASCTYTASAGRVASGSRAWPSTSSRTRMCALRDIEQVYTATTLNIVYIIY